MRSIIGPVLCAKCGHTAGNDVELPTTPIPDLQRNHIVSGSQTRMICGTITVSRSGISQLAGEITRLRGVIAGLIHKCDKLEICMWTTSSSSAPSPEILSEKFLQCKDTSFDDFYSYSFTPHLDKMPLLLGSVCSRWMTIDLLTLRLWASFAVTFQLEYWESHVTLATAWFERTGTSPLSIRLACHSDSYHTIQPLMQLFVLYCERWYNICISLPMSVTGFLLPAKNHLPRLQKVYADNIDVSETIDIPEYAPSTAPFSFWGEHLPIQNIVGPSRVKRCCS